MTTGLFVKFPMIYRHDGNGGLGNDDQAATTLAGARVLLAGGAPKVAITYSANEGQTKALVAAYAQGDYDVQIYGANQAQVMHKMLEMLSNGASDLLGLVEIAPITTIPDPGTDPQTIVTADLDRIEGQLKAGFAMLGWQNQDTINDPNHPFAIGGGVNKNIPAAVDADIQTRLEGFAATYPVPEDLLPDPWPPALS